MNRLGLPLFIVSTIAVALVLFSNFAPVVPHNTNYAVFSGSRQRCEVKDERRLTLSAYLEQLSQKDNFDPYERLVDVIGYSGKQVWGGVGYEIAPGIVLTAAHVVEPPIKKEDVGYTVNHHIRGEGGALPVNVNKEGDLALLVIPETDSYRVINQNSTRIRKGTLDHNEPVKGVKVKRVDSAGYFTPFERERQKLEEPNLGYIDAKTWPLDSFDRYIRTEELETEVTLEGDIEYIESTDVVKKENVPTRKGFSGSPLFDNDNNLAGVLVAIEDRLGGVGFKTDKSGNSIAYRFFGYDVAANNESVKAFLTDHCSSGK